MSQWRVYNDHTMDHKEKFKGDEIIIKAGKYILMDYEDAVQFKGQYFPMRMNADNRQDPESYKMIRIIQHDASAVDEKTVEFICNVDGKKFTTKKELDAYEAQFSHLVVEDPTLDEEMEKLIAKPKTKTMKEKTL